MGLRYPKGIPNRYNVVRNTSSIITCLIRAAGKVNFYESALLVCSGNVNNNQVFTDKVNTSKDIGINDHNLDLTVNILKELIE